MPSITRHKVYNQEVSSSQVPPIARHKVYNQEIPTPQIPPITHHEAYNQETHSSFNIISVDQTVQSTPTFVNFNTPVNKQTNRWTSSETRMLIEEIGKQWHALQKTKDAREKGRIWDRIIANIQTSDVASSSLKERTKASIQQKWDALLQKYRDIKDKIEHTGEEAIQNDWEFFKDMDNYLRKDPSIVAPIISDSIHGIKRKVPRNAEDHTGEEVTSFFINFFQYLN